MQEDKSVIVDIIAILLGVITIISHYFLGGAHTVLLIVSLGLFIVIDLFGLITGELKLTPFVGAPVIPALFIMPWYIGLLIGYLSLKLINLLITTVFGTMLFKRK